MAVLHSWDQKKESGSRYRRCQERVVLRPSKHPTEDRTVPMKSGSLMMSSLHRFDCGRTESSVRPDASEALIWESLAETAFGDVVYGIRLSELGVIALEPRRIMCSLCRTLPALEYTGIGRW